MDATPSPKRIKLTPSPKDDQRPEETDSLEEEHCTICLQSFIDRTIIPVCAHEFCFECILLWSEQSRKCPLCSRSFDDSYLIHHVRSQYDYQKHYLPPLRSSPSPLTGEYRANALRNTRRVRQWGHRQRQQREETDQLERAIARRRWIYQHHLYAKHVASNPYTRYRPFPTPAQFSASPDLMRRMTTFLRRELRVWPNLDIEFLTTYTISLMKSIDIRSESAVKLLSEFLDLDTPYTAGGRHVNAEHFAHEIYSYLRSPYRDLNTYDQTAQYDTPPEILPLQYIERGSRWNAEPSPSRRSRSRSRQPPVHHNENSAMRSPAASRRDTPAETRLDDNLNYRLGPTRSPTNREGHDFRNLPSSRRHSPPDGAQEALRDGHLGHVPSPAPLNPTALAENQVNDNYSIHPRFRDDAKGKGQTTEATEDIVIAANTHQMGVLQGGDSAAPLTFQKPDVTHLKHAPLQEASEEFADYVDNDRGSSSANAQSSRKHLASLAPIIRPRNRTLSESVLAYLSRPAAPERARKKPAISGHEQAIRTSDTHPKLPLYLTDCPAQPATGKPSSPRKTTVERTSDGPSTPDGDVIPVYPRCGGCFPPRTFLSDCVSLTAATRASGSDPKNGVSRPGRGGDDAAPLVGAPESLVDARGRTDAGTSSGPPALHAGRRRDDDSVAGAVDDASPSGDGSGSCGTLASAPAFGSGLGLTCAVAGANGTSGSVSESGRALESPESGVDGGGEGDGDGGASALERRLRARAHVRARLVALKDAVGSTAGAREGEHSTRIVKRTREMA